MKNGQPRIDWAVADGWNLDDRAGNRQKKVKTVPFSVKEGPPIGKVCQKTNDDLEVKGERESQFKTIF